VQEAVRTGSGREATDILSGMAMPPCAPLLNSAPSLPPSSHGTHKNEQARYYALLHFSGPSTPSRPHPAALPVWHVIAPWRALISMPHDGLCDPPSPTRGRTEQRGTHRMMGVLHGAALVDQVEATNVRLVARAPAAKNDGACAKGVRLDKVPHERRERSPHCILVAACSADAPVPPAF